MCVCVCVCVCAAIVERPRAETAAVIERAHIHISGAFSWNCYPEKRRWNKPRFQTHLKATSRRLSHVGPLRKTDHVRKKWNTPRDGGLHPSFCLPPPLAFNFLSWAPAVRLVPGCLGLICYDSNFKCLLGFKARQQIRRIIKVNGAFLQFGPVKPILSPPEGNETRHGLSERVRSTEDVLFGPRSIWSRCGTELSLCFEWWPVWGNALQGAANINLKPAEDVKQLSLINWSVWSTESKHIDTNDHF